MEMTNLGPPGPEQVNTQAPPQQTMGADPGMIHAANVLGQTQKFMVSQKRLDLFTRIAQTCTGPAPKEYDILNLESGEKLMHGSEESEILWRCCCQAMRPFKLNFADATGQTSLFVVDRPYRCEPGSCCYRQEINTFDNNGVLVGKVMEDFNGCPPGSCFPTYSVLEPSADGGMATWLKLHSKCNCLAKMLPCFFKEEFNLRYPEEGTAGAPAGMLSKDKNLLSLVTDEDRFLIEIPAQATAIQRVNLIALAVLVDFNFFERSKKDNDS